MENKQKCDVQGLPNKTKLEQFNDSLSEDAIDLKPRFMRNNFLSVYHRDQMLCLPRAIVKNGCENTVK